MKSNFYIILNEREKPRFDAHIEGILMDKDKEIIPIVFNKGRSLKEYKSNQFYIEVDTIYSETGKLRDKLSVIVNNNNPLFVVSEKLELLLKEIANDQVEFYNLRIEDNRKIYSNYKIVNIIHEIDCIDYKNSDLDFEYYDEHEPSGDVLTTYKLVLDESSIPMGLKIFLLGRYKDEFVVVHRQLKELINERGITGFVFCEVEDFSN